MDRSAWNGTFEQTGVKNLDDFMKKLGSTPDQINTVRNMKIVNELSNSGDDYCMKQKCGPLENVIKVTLGKKATIKTIDGLTLEGTVNIDKDNAVTGKYDGGFEEYMTIDEDGVITDTITFCNVSMVRTYKRM